MLDDQANAMAGKLVPTIGLVCAEMKIAMQPLACTMSQFLYL